MSEICAGFEGRDGTEIGGACELERTADHADAAVVAFVLQGWQFGEGVVQATSDLPIHLLTRLFTVCVLSRVHQYN